MRVSCTREWLLREGEIGKQSGVGGLVFCSCDMFSLSGSDHLMVSTSHLCRVASV